MTQTAEILIHLIRISIGTEKEVSLPADVNWEELARLSKEQFVPAIAIDGYMQLTAAGTDNQPKNGKGLTAVDILNSPEMRKTKLKWFSHIVTHEKNYATHLNTLHKLVQTYTNENIKTLILKGLSLAPYYPIPSHRPCGDIDIYLWKNFDKGNNIIRKKGIDITQINPKHSSFMIGSVNIENHKTLLRLDATESVLNSNEVISSTIGEAEYNEELKCYTPLPITNYLFLIRHMVTHMLENSDQLTLRHLLDWGFFLHAQKNKLDVKHANKLMDEIGLTQIKEILTRITQYVTRLDLSYVLEYKYDSLQLSEVEQRFLEDILAIPVVKSRSFFSRIMDIDKEWKSQKWKFEYVPDDYYKNFRFKLLREVKNKLKAFLKGEKIIPEK